MSAGKPYIRILGGWLAWSGLLVTLLEGLRLLAGAPLSLPGALARWAFVLGVLLTGRLSLPKRSSPNSWLWPWAGIGLAGLGLGAGLVYAWGVEAAAGLLLLVSLGSLLAFEIALEAGKAWPVRWLLRVAAAGLAGGFAIAVAQVETRFSEEEFFVALQGLALAAFWLVLCRVFAVLTRSHRSPDGERQGQTSHARRVVRYPGLRIRPVWTVLVVAVLLPPGIWFTIRSYQHSFYPLQAPTYAGITVDQPFECGTAPADPQTYGGLDTFRRILGRVAANPYRGAPEYAMLALGSQEQRWAEAFHTSLLEEAVAGRFTEPAQSVKYSQYEAAQRAYYYPRVRATFPGLFSPVEQRQVQTWFHAINRRALTVEWVDWLYALAFSKWPEGPYENQENGAGLLAVLEKEGLADPALSAQNRAYLDRNRRGWLERFRVTDDAVVYQPEWMNNAYYQSLYVGEVNAQNVRHSYEWLLAQALPDGSPLQYNHPGSLTLADHAYLGATELKDERYIWLAGRAADDLESHAGILAAKPGLEAPVNQNGRSPDLGSCLLYGDSGLPNQLGPLAPDKIVFRDGWSVDSAYLLLNLRFTGWHRYKATNTLTLLYQAGPLAVDQTTGERFTWLPSGRSHFRDKRVPRENLNGLVIERSGLSQVLYLLTGIGGPWAQDPPFYAQVESFETGPERDSSQTILHDWHGWDHQRAVYLYRSGPVVIFDQASGPPGRQAALFWHLPGESSAIEGGRFRLRSGPAPAELLVLPISPGEILSTPAGQDGLSAVQFRPVEKGRLALVSVFLTRAWVGARAELVLDQAQPVLKLSQPNGQITLPLSPE